MDLRCAKDGRGPRGLCCNGKPCFRGGAAALCTISTHRRGLFRSPASSSGQFAVWHAFQGPGGRCARVKPAARCKCVRPGVGSPIGDCGVGWRRHRVHACAACISAECVDTCYRPYQASPGGPTLLCATKACSCIGPCTSGPAPGQPSGPAGELASCNQRNPHGPLLQQRCSCSSQGFAGLGRPIEQCRQHVHPAAVGQRPATFNQCRACGSMLAANNGTLLAAPAD